MHIVRAKRREDTCAFQLVRHVGLQLAYDNTDVTLLEAHDDACERGKAGGVDERHAAHAQHDRGYVRLHPIEHAFELLCRTEEERPVDVVHHDTRHRGRPARSNGSDRGIPPYAEPIVATVG